MDQSLHLVGNDVLQQRLISLKTYELYGILLSLNGQDLVVRRELDGPYGTATVAHAKGDDDIVGRSRTFDHHTSSSSRPNSKYLYRYRFLAIINMDF